MPPVSSWIHPRKLLTRTISIVLLKFPPRLFVFSRIATPQNTFHIIFPQTRTVEWNVRDWKSCRIPQLVFRRLAVCSPKISSRFERGEKKNWDEKKEKLSAEKFTCVRNCDVENKKKAVVLGLTMFFAYTHAWGRVEGSPSSSRSTVDEGAWPFTLSKSFYYAKAAEMTFWLR